MADDTPSIMRSKKPADFTYRGLPVSSNKGKPVSGGQLGSPPDYVKRTVRKRSGSIRRQNKATLQELAGGSGKWATVAQAARRELDVRAQMLAVSQDQNKGQRMKSTGAAQEQDVEALRFASSLAEEAIEADPKLSRGKAPFGMIGVARHHGQTGMGFSGDESQQATIDRVSQGMLALQEGYEKSDPDMTARWSHKLTPVAAPTVLHDDSGDSGSLNVCAASRASAAALASVSSELSQAPTVKRSALPTADALLEMQSPAFSKSPGRPFTDYQEFNQTAQVSDQLKSESDHYDVGSTVATRQRSASVVSMVKSCEQCMAETTAKRSAHQHD